MKLKKMDHVGIIVEDLESVKVFFNTLGLELIGEQNINGEWIDNIYGVDALEASIAMMKVPHDETAIELIQFRDQSSMTNKSLHFPRNIGASHFAFSVQNIEQIVEQLAATSSNVIGEITQFEDMYKLCYIRRSRRHIYRIS
ncbi:VOC family protein [Mammaliicoccus sciuri]